MAIKIYTVNIDPQINHYNSQRRRLSESPWWSCMVHFVVVLTNLSQSGLQTCIHWSWFTDKQTSSSSSCQNHIRIPLPLGQKVGLNLLLSKLCPMSSRLKSTRAICRAVLTLKRWVSKCPVCVCQCLPKSPMFPTDPQSYHVLQTSLHTHLTGMKSIFKDVLK